MNNEVMTAGGLCFLGSLLAGIWPRYMADKARKAGYPNVVKSDNRISLRAVREADKKLYCQYLAGLALFLLLTMAWAILFFIGLT